MQPDCSPVQQDCMRLLPRGSALQSRVALYQAKSWSFSGIDLAQLAQDCQAQRTELAAFDQVESTYHNAKETFGVAQEGRHRRFAAPPAGP
jgi:hypothetical protein